MNKAGYQPKMKVYLKHFLSPYSNWYSFLNLTCNNPDGTQTYFQLDYYALGPLRRKTDTLNKQGCKFNDLTHNIYLKYPKSINCKCLKTIVVEKNMSIFCKWSVNKKTCLPAGSQQDFHAAIFYFPSFRFASLTDRFRVYRNDPFSPACFAGPWIHFCLQSGRYVLFFADLCPYDSFRNLPDLCVS